MRKKDDTIVGLDIGTTKICAVVGEETDTGVDIIGIGIHPSKGLRRGVVVNIDSTINSIKKAIEEAELMAGCEIGSVFAGIAGSHIKGFNSHGIVAVKNGEVSNQDLTRVIEAAKAVAIPLDRETIHILPQEYIIDDQDGIKEPLGMAGVRLEAKIHIVTGAVSAAQNIIKCANQAGLDVNDIVLEPLASSEAVLSEEEKDIGVGLIDIGGGTTDLAIFTGGSLRHTTVLPFGGSTITHDLSLGLRTPTESAEQLKLQYGCCLSPMLNGDGVIEVPSVGGRKPRNITHKVLCEIIEPRVEEIFSLVGQEIERSGYAELLGSGVVVTGGSAIMKGIPELAEQIFGLPARRGFPMDVGGLTDIIDSPMHATGVGLIHYGYKHRAMSRFRIRDENIFSKVTRRMSSWFSDFF